MSNKLRYCGIDSSTKTGFVILDSEGKLLYENEIRSKFNDPLRMIDIWNQIVKHLNVKTDIVCIEGFSYGSKGRGVGFQYGLGWVLRTNLHLQGFKYVDVTPTQLKKFACNIGNAKKEALVQPIMDKWGYTHKSDNVIDGYVLARIAFSMRNTKGLRPYELKIVNDLLAGNT